MAPVKWRRGRRRRRNKEEEEVMVMIRNQRHVSIQSDNGVVVANMFRLYSNLYFTN